MLQNYRETYMNFLGIFLKVFWTKKYKKITSFIKDSKKDHTYFLSSFLLCNKVIKHQESHQKFVEIYLEFLKEILTCKRCKKHATWCKQQENEETDKIQQKETQAHGL
jgi:hypothetical protein